jgi:hypothetical protein
MVSQFRRYRDMGRVAIAEIEFPFITKTGKYFQPRLRRIFTESDEQ